MAEKKPLQPSSRIRLLFPNGCRDSEILKTMAEVNEKYPDRHFEVKARFPPELTRNNVMETIVQMKWRLHKLVLIAHGEASPNPKCLVSKANSDKRCELPQNVTLVFYCNRGEKWSSKIGNLHKYISAVCAGAKGSSEIVQAGQKYDDLILTYVDSEWGLENPDQVKPCDPTQPPLVFPNESRLSDLIAKLDSGFLWELHVMACRSDSKNAPLTHTGVTYDVRGFPVFDKTKIKPRPRPQSQHGGQCQGLTYKGQPCKRHGDPYCYQHNA
jgi:hypothetical protein